MLRYLLQKLLQMLAVLVLRRHKPRLVAITGTVGKTSAKEAVASALSRKFRVRQSQKNYNNELGVPLAIMDLESGGGSALKWILTLLRGCGRTLGSRDYPQVLVLEFGIDKPGDMEYLTSFVPLDYAVITALGEVPVHVEFFKNREALWEEKLAIAKGLRPEGILFYNADDTELARRTTATALHAVAYGTGETATVRAQNIQKMKTAEGLPIGLECTVIWADGETPPLPLRLPGLLGRHQLSAVLAALAVGKAFGVSPAEMAEALEGYEPPPGRLRVLPGVKGTLLIDDTYNASPASVEAALRTLKDFAPRRRLAVLGDMLELGDYEEQAHRTIGRIVGDCADGLWAVGKGMRIAAEEARRSGMEEVSAFDLSLAAAKPLELALRAGDVVLIKGSQSLRMEKIVEEIMAEPNRAAELLVRQEESWKKKAVEAT